MKKLIICNTNSQIIMALQLKLTLFKNDKLDIIITDHIIDGLERSARIEKINLFDKVYFIKALDKSKSSTPFKNFLYSLSLGVGRTSLQINDLYDEVLTYNFDVFTYEIVNSLEKQNKKIIWSQYDEGLFSYNTGFYLDGFRSKIISFLRMIRGKQKYISLFSKFYCMYPELRKIHTEWDSIMIPGLKNSLNILKLILKEIYDYTDVKIEEKYIYFASSSDVDGHSFGEHKYVLELAKLLGINQLLVKKHPRDITDVYENNCLHVMKNSNYPWELIQILSDMNDKVLLTCTSGSFISISAMLGTSIPSIFLYPDIKKFDSNYLAYIKEIENIINTLHANDKCNNIMTCKKNEILVLTKEYWHESKV